MSKKILAIVLTAALMLSMAVIPAAAAEAQFSDTDGHWAKAEIDQWADYGVVEGHNGKFNPNADMTRAEYATAMVNLLGLTKKSNWNPFSDLKGDEWYADAMLKAYSAGILLGDESKRCKGSATVSREQAFVMAGRALGVKPVENADLSDYKDGGKVSSWAKPMMAALVESGFVNGTSPTTLAPAAQITRASVMKVLANTVTTYVTEPGEYTAEGKGFVVVKAEGEVTITGKADGIVVGQSSTGATVNLEKAEVTGDIRVDAPKVKVNVEDSKVAGSVEITPQASGAELNVAAGSTVENVSTQADGVAVKGEGEVKQVEVNGGDKVDIATPGTKVEVSKDVESEVTAGGQPVKPGESSTTTGEPEGYPETTPTPDNPSGGGTVTPSGKTSGIGNVVASTGLSWAGAPADKAMKLAYTTNSTTITATGALVYAEGFTGFNSTVTAQQSGYYAFFKIPVNEADYTVAKAAEGTIFSLGKKTWDKDGDSDGNKGFIIEGTEKNRYIEMVLRVAGADKVMNNITFAADWDGDAADYRKTSYTIDLSKVKLTANPYSTIVENNSLFTVTSGGTAAATVNVTGEIPYEAASSGNILSFTITPPAGFTGTAPLAFTVNGAGSTADWNNGVVRISYTAGTLQTANTVKVTWVDGYEQTITVNTSSASLASAVTAVAHSGEGTILGKNVSDFQTGVTVTQDGLAITITAGTLKYVENWTAFSSTDNSGNFVLFDLKAPSGITTPVANTVVMKQYTDGNKSDVKKTYTYDVFDGDCNYLWKVSGKDAKLYLGIDWDGEGTAYTETLYTIQLADGVTLNPKPVDKTKLGTVNPATCMIPPASLRMRPCARITR